MFSNCTNSPECREGLRGRGVGRAGRMQVWSFHHIPEVLALRRVRWTGRLGTPWARTQAEGLAITQPCLTVQMCSVYALRPCFRFMLFLPPESRGQIQWGLGVKGKLCA